MEPPNKGKKMSKEQYEKCKATMFKKGNKLWNTRTKGDRRISKDGYIEIKIADGVWELEHRKIYREHHGEIPEGYVITFLDGDKTNLDIDNLEAISCEVNARLQNKNLRFKDKELTKVGINIVKIISKTKELSKR